MVVGLVAAFAVAVHRVASRPATPRTVVTARSFAGGDVLVSLRVEHGRQWPGRPSSPPGRRRREVVCTALAVSPRHLVMLPLPDVAEATEALAAIARLEQTDPLEVLGVAVVERRGDGSLHVALVPWPVSAQIDIAAWRWLLGGILEGPGPPGGDEPPGAPLGGAVFSESFLVEVRAVVAGAGRSLALVVAGFDAAAAVSELRGFPGAKLVYGVLPEPVLERMVTRPLRPYGGDATGTDERNQPSGQ